jgi:NitT/TauT family transport system substrate-binding protein
VLAVFSEGSPEVAKAGIDVSKTYTNAFVEKAKKSTGASSK